MSYFTVLVIGDDVENQLEPYNENVEVKPYKRKCWCIDRIAKDETRKRIEKEYNSIDNLREEFKKEKDQSNEHWQEFIAHYSFLEKQYIAVHPMHDKPDLQCTECKGTGKETTTYNKKSKWNWYQIGGRWAGMLKLKKKATSGIKGEKSLLDKTDPYIKGGVDSALKKDIDFDIMQNDKEEKQNAEKNWDEVIANKGFYKPEYFLKRYGTKENYVKSSLRFVTHAVVKEGKWYEAGQMGWFGCSSETVDEEKLWEEKFFTTFIKPLSNNTQLTIVDCHI